MMENAVMGVGGLAAFSGNALPAAAFNAWTINTLVGAAYASGAHILAVLGTHLCS
jgi:hypothetical protein